MKETFLYMGDRHGFIENDAAGDDGKRKSSD